MIKDSYEIEPGVSVSKTSIIQAYRVLEKRGDVSSFTRKHELFIDGAVNDIKEITQDFYTKSHREVDSYGISYEEWSLGRMKATFLKARMRGRNSVRKCDAGMIIYEEALKIVLDEGFIVKYRYEGRKGEYFVKGENYHD